jgi:hypothetical protein
VDINYKDDDVTGGIRRLMFTFYAKGSILKPEYYLIVVTDPKDLFFCFNSEKLTPAKFIEVTKRLKVQIPVTQNETIPYKKSQAQAKRARQAALGFTNKEGAGGVLGVISGDCLEGLKTDPERYEGFFQISSQGVGTIESLEDLKISQLKSDSSHLSQSKSPSKSLKSNQMTGSGLSAASDKSWKEDQKAAVLSHSIKSQGANSLSREAKLFFQETVMYRTSKLLSLRFIEAGKQEIMKRIQDQYQNLQVLFYEMIF